jgi:hypothetical protein
LRTRGCGARETALFLGRTRARLPLKELGSLSGGLHHNAVSIATRRFSLRLQTDRALQRKLTLVEKSSIEISPLEAPCNVLYRLDPISPRLFPGEKLKS